MLRLRSRYTIPVKRTNPVHSEKVLMQARKESGAKTNSPAVNSDLDEATRLRKIQSLRRFFGSAIWEGDLSEMRDRKRAPRRGIS
jgi:hypothetical protein